METINGQWIMKGCRPDSPDCIHNTEELCRLIHSIGFIPLFSNSIPGFSVEEHTDALCWWNDNPETDPWIWRQTVSRYPDIAYGKFFGKTAGFISKEWFPVFANYRRNGYDFDARCDDGLASYRTRKIMDTFNLDEKMKSSELMSFDIKNKAGFGKGGEKNFEGVLTELQMQTYLIISDFKQRKNKKGQEYGWHIALLETPETKWGYDYITSCYNEKPEESWTRTIRQMNSRYPEAAEKDIIKLVGFR